MCSSSYLEMHKTINGQFFIKCYSCGYESPVVDSVEQAKVIWLA